MPLLFISDLQRVVLPCSLCLLKHEELWPTLQAQRETSGRASSIPGHPMKSRSSQPENFTAFFRNHCSSFEHFTPLDFSVSLNIDRLINHPLEPCNIIITHLIYWIHWIHHWLSFQVRWVCALTSSANALGPRMGLKGDEDKAWT